MTPIGLVRTPSGDLVAVTLDGSPDGWNGYVATLRIRAAMEGACPECGAQLRMPNRAARRAAERRGEFARASMAHESTCPAGDSSVTAGGWSA